MPQTMDAPAQVRTLPTRIPTANVATAIVDFIRANADPETKTLQVSMSQIAKAIGLDFSRVLRAKDQLVAAGVLEQDTTNGKTYTYKLLRNEVPQDLVFRHKDYQPATQANWQPTTQVTATVPASQSLNKSQIRQLSAALSNANKAVEHLNRLMTEFKVLGA
jgi:membrane-bound lytic murein transglycosylase MltF